MSCGDYRPRCSLQTHTHSVLFFFFFQSCALKQAAARSVLGRVRLLSDRAVKGKGKNKGTEIWTCLLSPTPFPPLSPSSAAAAPGSF